MVSLLSSKSEELPSTCKAVVLEAREQPLKVGSIDVPEAAPGRAIVKVLSTIIVPFSKEVYGGKRTYPYPTPMVPGGSCVGRVVAVGDDSTSINPGQLVFVHMFIIARDDNGSRILFGLNSGYTDGQNRLMAGEWRNSTWAEYVKAPLENCIALNENILSQSLGYTSDDLSYIQTLLVPYGGLRGINLTAGETIIISPATATFGGAAIQVALAMGAGRVIAMGRNTGTLEKLAALDPRISTVQMTGDVGSEMGALRKFAPIDAFFDISPPMAQQSTHIRSAILSLRFGGRVALMSGLVEDYPLPTIVIMGNSITIQGKYMYEPSDIPGFMGLVNSGVLKLGEKGGNKIVAKFGLDDCITALDVASEHPGLGEIVVFNP